MIGMRISDTCPWHRELRKRTDLKALIICDIVAQKHSLRAINIIANHLSANRLPANVPNLQGDVHLRQGRQPAAVSAARTLPPLIAGPAG